MKGIDNRGDTAPHVGYVGYELADGILDMMAMVSELAVRRAIARHCAIRGIAPDEELTRGIVEYAWNGTRAQLMDEFKPEE